MIDPHDPYEEIREMQEEQVIALIRDTVTRLNTLGDRLEEYAAEREPLQVGFKLEQEPGDTHVGETNEQP